MRFPAPPPGKSHGGLGRQVRAHLETTEFVRASHYKTATFKEHSAADKAYLHVNFFDSHKNPTELVPSFSRWYS